MVRTLAALLLAACTVGGAGRCAAAEGSRGAAIVSALADSKVMALDLLDARLDYAPDRAADALRLSLLRDAMDQMADADAEDVKVLRSEAGKAGASVALKVAVARLDRANAGVERFVARLVTADRPIQLPAEAETSEATVVEGPMPVAVAAR